MTKDEVKELALSCGFKLKEQPDGEMDLNSYVYEFAFELESKVISKFSQSIDKIEFN